MLYGFALLYGATGHTDLGGIGEAVRAGGPAQTMILIAMVLVLAGLAFKISAVPFHMWAPDAYEGAPTPATTYMAAVVKAGAFAMLLRVLFTCFAVIPSIPAMITCDGRGSGTGRGGNRQQPLNPAAAQAGSTTRIIVRSTRLSSFSIDA